MRNNLAASESAVAEKEQKPSIFNSIIGCSNDSFALEHLGCGDNRESFERGLKKGLRTKRML